MRLPTAPGSAELIKETFGISTSTDCSELLKERFHLSNDFHPSWVGTWTGHGIWDKNGRFWLAFPEDNFLGTPRCM